MGTIGQLEAHRDGSEITSAEYGIFYSTLTPILAGGRGDVFHFRSFGTCWSFLPCIAMQRQEQNLFKVVVGWSSLLLVG